MKKLLLQTFKQTFASTKFSKWFLGSVTAIFGLLLFGKNFFGLPIALSIKIGIGVILGVYLLRFIGLLAINSYAFYRETRRLNVYGNAIIILNEAFSKLHWLRKHEVVSEKQLVDAMRYLCQQLKLIFDGITGHKCAVSIKVPVKTSNDHEIGNNTLVRNFARDKSSSLKRDTDAYRETPHSIIDNTCFYEIITQLALNKKDNLFYRHNNIKSDNNYRTTSVECYDDGILPYDSELVVPIIPLQNDKKNIYKLIGFICVDGPVPNLFNQLYDVAIMQGVADGIYDLLKPDLEKIKLKPEDQ